MTPWVRRVLGEVGAQARHGVGEVAYVDGDERALFCPGQVFLTALHLAIFRVSAGGSRQMVRRP
jgi:hypothetical protein